MMEFRKNPTPQPVAPQMSCRQLTVRRIADVICEMQGSGEPVTEEALEARNIPPALAGRLRAEALKEARHNFIKRG